MNEAFDLNSTDLHLVNDLVHICYFCMMKEELAALDILRHTFYYIVFIVILYKIKESHQCTIVRQ